jgi:hypothetical protein
VQGEVIAMRRPRIELGSRRWQRPIITTRPTALVIIQRTGARRIVGGGDGTGRSLSSVGRALV